MVTDFDSIYFFLVVFLLLDEVLVLLLPLLLLVTFFLVPLSDFVVTFLSSFELPFFDTI